MKTITISSRSRQIFEKTGSGGPGDEFLGIMEGLLTASVTALRKNMLVFTQVGVYFQFPEGQIANSGDSVLHDARCLEDHELPCRIRAAPC